MAGETPELKVQINFHIAHLFDETFTYWFLFQCSKFPTKNGFWFASQSKFLLLGGGLKILRSPSQVENIPKLTYLIVQQCISFTYNLYFVKSPYRCSTQYKSTISFVLQILPSHPKEISTLQKVQFSSSEFPELNSRKVINVLTFEVLPKYNALVVN